jgi:hypothetical protein
LGRGSRTTPLTSEGRRGTNGDCTKADEAAEFGVPTRRFAPTSPHVGRGLGRVRRPHPAATRRPPHCVGRGHGRLGTGGRSV